MQIFKLAQGEYVAVERIEASYKKLPLIQQLFAYGNSMESVLVAVVVPEESALVEAAKKEGISFSSYTELLKLSETKAMLLKQMDATAKEFKMKASLTRSKTVAGKRSSQHDFASAQCMSIKHFRGLNSPWKAV